MKTTVLVPFEFYASHSLSVRETPHTHHWTLKLFVTGIPRNGMVIDILKLREITNPHIERIANTYLNENEVLDQRQAEYPTCEMLCMHFFSHVAPQLEGYDVELSGVEVEIREPEGNEWGSARLEVD